MKEKYNVEEEQSEQIVESFITVIEDASSYLFSLNHSLPYSYIGYICGYLRYYYPLEFITTSLNINKDDAEKTSKTIEYAKKNNIIIKQPRFRYSKAEYFMDKESNAIYKGIASIKYMNENVANEMYALKDNEYNSFMELLIDLLNKTSINSRQLYILITSDFFEEFGKSYKLLKTVDVYNDILSKKLKSKKGEVSFNKNGLDLPKGLIEKYATEKSKEDRYKQYKVENAEGLCDELLEQVPNIEMSSVEKVRTILEMFGECSYNYEDFPESIYIAMNVNTKYKTKKCNLYNISNGKMIEVKVGEGFFDEKPFKDLNVVEVYSYVDKPKKVEVLVQEEDKNGNIVEKRRWRNSDTEREIWITEYLVLNEEEIKELNEEELSYKIENI